jgi:hypothetical protein
MLLVRQLTIAVLLLSGSDALASMSTADAATVFIGVFEEDDLVGAGSGFFVSPRGYLVTNEHVVAGEQRRFFVIFNGEIAAEAFVVKTNVEKDLALLKVDVEEEIETVTLANSPPKKGDAIFALGFPGSQIRLLSDLYDMGISGSITATVTDGVVSNFYELPLGDTGTTATFVQHTAEFRQGNSGGPLVNLCGEVVGVNTLGMDFSETTSVGAGQDYFSVASSELIQFLGSRNYATVTDVACNAAFEAKEQSAVKVAKNDLTTTKRLPGDPFWKAVGGWPTLLGGLAVTIALVLIILDRRPVKISAQQDSLGVIAEKASPSYSTLSGTGFDSRGHAFSFSITESEAAGDGCIVGRSRDCSDVLMDDETISRAHLIIRRSGGAFEAMDMNSTNHSALNGRRLEPFKSAVLKKGDELSMGTINLSISID